MSGIRYTFSSKKQSGGIGTYSAFATALGTTIGPGNITGVAVAISAGGAGAVVWMWLSGILAMATKYAEGYLALRYSGSTDMLLKTIDRPRLSVLWTLTCGCAGLLMGAAVPSDSLASALPIPEYITGTVLALLVILTVSFGLRGIARVANLLVPVMSVLFIGFCITVIAINYRAVPAVVCRMFKEAFSFSALVGGTLGNCIKCGVTRGLYSNESGLGSGGVLAADSGDDDHIMGALSSMTTVFWDTVVMCALTGIMFLVAGGDGNASSIVKSAFGALPFGTAILSVCMSLFVFACIIGWYYIAHRTLRSVFKKTHLYDLLFIFSVFIGAVAKSELIWRLSDAVNLLMLLPSLYVLLKMSDKILYMNNN